MFAGCGFVQVNADDALTQDQLQQQNNVSARSEANLWDRMRDGFKLDHTETKEVKYWEKRYGSPKYFNIIMQNAAPYLYFVVSEMERRGVPTELALIPIVESTYNPQAVSPAAISTGMWQFVSSSGKRFGMTQNSDIDERKDIIKSTRAAITYLIYLHDMFGSWELAIAAYNWGEGNIYNAMTSSGSKNFYDLDVRDVTRQYVPKVIALANIIQNPDKFGIKLTNLNNSPYFGIIQPPVPTSLNDIISTASVSPDQFKKLNPQFASNSYVANQSQRVLLPLSNQNVYLASIGKNPLQPIVPPVVDDNAAQMAAIDLNQAPANNVNTTPSQSDGINQLASGFADDNTSSAANVAVVNNNTTNTTVIAATTTIAISNNDNNKPSNTSTVKEPQVQINDLLNDNGPNAVKVANTEGSTAGNGNSVSFINYTVVVGDTLYSIARKFSIPVDNIKADNQLTDNTVKLNQILRIRSNQPQMKS